jgi:hypothetical protein
MWLSIEKIKVSEKQKLKVDKHKVDKHRKHLEEGGDLMPIDVVQINADEYCICGNGRHRYFGVIEAGFTMIEVNVLNE